MELSLSGNDRKPEGMEFTNHINSLFSTIINCIIAVGMELTGMYILLSVNGRNAKNHGIFQL